MIIAYDPVSRDVTIDLEDGTIPRSYPVDCLLVSHYGELGVLIADIGQADMAVVGLDPLPHEPPPVIQLEFLGPGTWRVRVFKGT